MSSGILGGLRGGLGELLSVGTDGAEGELLVVESAGLDLLNNDSETTEPEVKQRPLLLQREHTATRQGGECELPCGLRHRFTRVCAPQPQVTSPHREIRYFCKHLQPSQSQK